MKSIESFISAFIYSIKLISRKRLYFHFIPAILISILFFTVFAGGRSVANFFSFIEDWWLVGWLFSSTKTILSLISFTIFEFLILVLLSPMNSIFAEKVREDITGEKLGFSFPVFLRSLQRMIAILFVGFSAQILLLLVLWIFSFLLGDLFFEVASMLNIAFFIGFSFFDFGLELDEIKSGKSWQFARKNWMACILIGLVFNLGIYYPQKIGLIPIYLAAISLLPHLLTVTASKMYYDLNHRHSREAGTSIAEKK